MSDDQNGVSSRSVQPEPQNDGLEEDIKADDFNSTIYLSLTLPVFLPLNSPSNLSCTHALHSFESASVSIMHGMARASSRV